MYRLIAQVLDALANAAYPIPAIVTTGDRPATLMWGVGIPGRRCPQTVFSTGTVAVSINRNPDAFFSAADTSAWLTVLHPHIADIVAHDAACDPIPAPAPLRWSTLPAFGYLSDDNNGVYAAFADSSRLWLTSDDPITTLDLILGTITGYQLGITAITAITAIAVATRHSIIYLNVALTHPTAEPAFTGYQPALAIADQVFLLPHPRSEHTTTTAQATQLAAERLAIITATGHIYPSPDL